MVDYRNYHEIVKWGFSWWLEQLSSWIMAIDDPGFVDDAFPDVITLERLRERWVEARNSMSTALATLKNEPAPLASIRPRSMMRRWLMRSMRLWFFTWYHLCFSTTSLLRFITASGYQSDKLYFFGFFYYLQTLRSLVVAINTAQSLSTTSIATTSRKSITLQHRIRLRLAMRRIERN